MISAGSVPMTIIPTMNINRHLVVVVGPTGSGKTDLGVSLAEHYGTEIISTDSRQIYRGMAIGSAQPSPEQMYRVKHHFIACVDIDKRYNCAMFETQALQRLDELFAGHDTVIAVGGAGLYVDALCEGLDDLPDADMALREKLQADLHDNGLECLVERLRILDPEYYENVDRRNPARILRALEVCIQASRPYSELRRRQTAQRDFNIIKIGVQRPRELLYSRIDRRVDIMIEQGLVDEARALYPFRNLKSLQTVGYKELFEYFDGTISFEQAVELVKRNSRRYAKRQMTWFSRDEKIQWFAPENISEIISWIDLQKINHVQMK